MSFQRDFDSSADSGKGSSKQRLRPSLRSPSVVSLFVVLAGPACARDVRRPEDHVSQAPTSEFVQRANEKPAAREVAKTTLPEARCVSLAAPPSGLLVRSKGEAYVLSADGYLHSFGASLEHRFSFSLEGLPVGIVEVGEGVLVSTTSRIFTSIHARGAERYHFRVLSRPHFGPSIDGNENLYFVGADRFVYSVSSHGAAHFRVEMKSEPIGAPIVGASGKVWVPLKDGLVELDGSKQPKRIVENDSFERAQAGPGGVWFSAAGKLGHLVSGGAIEWEDDAVAWDARPEAGAFSTSKGLLKVRSGEGEREFSLDAPATKIFVVSGQVFAAFAKSLRGYDRQGLVTFESDFPGEISDVRRAGETLFVVTGDGRLCRGEI